MISDKTNKELTERLSVITNEFNKGRLVLDDLATLLEELQKEHELITAELEKRIK